MEEENTKTIQDFIGIVKRRKWSIILPAVGVFLIAALVVLVMPRTYRSTSVILIEEQELPREFVAVAVTSYAEQRLQTINQRIMSTARLQGVIEKFNLYPEMRRRSGQEAVIERMRKDIQLKMISADVKDPQTGSAKSATIAFSLSFEGEHPDTAQQVANGLTSLYLEENLRVREQAMAGTAKFLEDEAKMIQAELARVDSQIASFKQRNVNELPELFQFNLSEMTNINRDLDRLVDQLKTLKEREEYLRVELAGIPRGSDDEMLLRELKTRLVQLQSKYSDKSSVVVHAKEEIAQMEKRLAETGKGKEEIGPLSHATDSPAYIAVASQLAGVRSEIGSLQRQIRELQAKRGRFAARVEATPRTEEEHKALVIDRASLQAKYDDLMKKLMEARVAHGLEKDQMGERFTLIDPAKLPEKPASPNVPAILLIGVVLGIGAGVGTASLREFTDDSVRNTNDLERLTGFPVLGAVPVIVTVSDRVRAAKRRKIVMAGAAAAMVVAIIIFHFFVMDLDILFSKVIRRTGV